MADTMDRIEIPGMLIANSHQIRRMAGTAQRLNFPYALDFRINSMLDWGGLHTVLLDRFGEDGEGPSLGEGVESMDFEGLQTLTFRAFVYLKMAGLSPDDPVSAWLSLRFRDYIRLEPTDRYFIPHLKRMRDAMPLDELSPEPVDPYTAPLTPVRPAFSAAALRRKRTYIGEVPR